MPALAKFMAMPPPMVPAPMTPPLRTSRGFTPAGMSGTFWASRSAKKMWRWARDSSLVRSSMNSSSSRAWPSPNGLSKLLRTDFDAGRDRAQPPRALRRGVSRAGEARRVGARGGEPVLAVAHAGERALLGDDLAGEGDRLLDDVAGDDRVDDAVLLQLLDRRRVAGEDELERPFRPDEPRQALRAAGAGQEPELDLGQADAGARRRDAVMAAERELEAAAERRAVQRGDDRLAASPRSSR